MSTATRVLLTSEEFALLPENGLHLTLVRGQVIETALPGARYGIIAAKLVFQLSRWAEGYAAGIVGLRSGVILARNPDTVRGPAAWFVRADRVPSDGLPDTFWDLAPDLAVEVVSPSETANDVREKVQDYLDAGTALVIVIYPKMRALVAHTPDGLARTYRSDETFTAPDVLPGFSCRVAELFS